MPRGAVPAMYAASGVLGLIYEVAFNKYLAYVFGATAWASSAVLVAFMGGLALGAYVAARLERFVRRPLLAYAAAEALIGIFCMFVPGTFHRLSVFYVNMARDYPDSLAAVSLLRGLLAVAVVAVPAAGMGATLPLLARFVADGDGSAGKQALSRLYALNTLGGALGSLASAYLVIPMFGLAWTMRGTASVSLAIGVIAAVMGLTIPARRPALPTPGRPSDVHVVVDRERIPIRQAMVVAAASGVLVFAAEVVFVHLLALVIGTSVYAFGLMLAIFLVCLSLGTPVATRLSRRFGPGALPVGCAMTGLALLGSLLLWDRLPSLFVFLGPHVRTWAGRELVRGLAAAVVLLVPVVAMGTTFPLVLRSARPLSFGRDVGHFTVANTLGSIVGSLLGGFVMLGALGSQKSLVAIALVYLALAVAASTEVAARRGRPRTLAAAGVVLALVVPRWDLATLTSGANVYFDAGAVPRGAVEFVREDVHGGVTTVIRDAEGTRTLLTNGKFEGNDRQEIRDNRGFAHLPVMFAAQRRRALVVGLGTGTSAGTIAAYDFHEIDVAELSPAIVDRAGTTFAEVNHHVMDDPRLKVHLEDGRNLLLVRKKAYDVISIEITSIWFSGAANLYSREFYELASRRLERGGVMQQWLQLHHTNRRNVATVLGTLRAVFPHVLLAVSGHQGLLLASEEELVVRRDALVGLEKVGYVAAALDGGHLVDYAKGIVLDEDGIDAFVKDTAESASMSVTDFVSTDQNLFLEYATPRGNVPNADDISDTLKYLSSYRTRQTLPQHIRL